MAIQPIGVGAAVPAVPVVPTAPAAAPTAAPAASAGGAGSPTGVTPLSDAGSILAESVEIGDDDDGGAFADGYEVDLSDEAMDE